VKASLVRIMTLGLFLYGAVAVTLTSLMKSKSAIRITLAAVGNIGQADRCFPCSLDERRRSAWPNI
jgi:hypothetical protein